MKKLKILLVNNTKIPALNYGGTERVIWSLGKELVHRGHEVYYLVGKGSTCPFATVLEYNPQQSLAKQIPSYIDIIHLPGSPSEPLAKPYIVMIQGNTNTACEYDINSVFVSQNHAKRHHSESFVHNGIDPEDYGKPDFSIKRQYLHFLGNAAWKVKNVKQAIQLTRQCHERLAVLGGSRLNLKMGLRFTWDRHVSFYGMVGGEKKNRLLNGSKGLVFPVLWHEPFGLAITESLYFGCPVFGTTYGSLPELVTPEVGFLSNSQSALVQAMSHLEVYNPRQCHEYVCDTLTARHMTDSYLKLYSKVLDGNTLNPTKPYFSDIQQQKLLPMEE
ncbi:MAG: glycosyltransferase [Bacteroidota bacterium]